MDLKEKMPGFIDEDRVPVNTKTSCISGKEHLPAAGVSKPVQQFRYNRVRLVPDDKPTDGRRPCYFNTEPGQDKFGLRVAAETASNYRKNGLKHTNVLQYNAFKPYGNVSSHYNSYVVDWPTI